MQIDALTTATARIGLSGLQRCSDLQIVQDLGVFLARDCLCFFGCVFSVCGFLGFTVVFRAVGHK